MQIKVQEQIRDKPELASAVDRGIEMLKEEIEPARFSGDVTAEWTFPDERPNGNGVKFRMYDPYSSWERNFSPNELADEDRLASGIRKMWLQLLKVRTDLSSEKIRQMLDELDSEEEE
jgi:hypothetical protein